MSWLELTLYVDNIILSLYALLNYYGLCHYVSTLYTLCIHVISSKFIKTNPSKPVFPYKQKSRQNQTFF